MSAKVILIIMDGWAHGQHPNADAIYQAETPFVKGLYTKYPHCELITHSHWVGLPDGQMGNSEVGHLNLGAGRIVYQELARINKAIDDGELKTNAALNAAFDYCKQNNKKLHLMGLVSNGGVHSEMKHIHALLDYAEAAGVPEYFVHAFTDGRDTDPQSGVGFIKELGDHLNGKRGRIASVIGRYYAMDRDNRWERVKLAYDMLAKGEGALSMDPIKAVSDSYLQGVTDEFIKPVVITGADHKPLATIAPGDAVLCFNFRTDRCREITRALTQQDITEQGMQKMDLHYVTMTIYDHSFVNINPIFVNEDVTMTLGEVMEQHKKQQIRIAETEKYPHVTFFFSGGREKPFDGESRIMIPSPKVATYDLQPEMSAYGILNAILPEINKAEADFICLNFANTDMVGHTGVFKAAMKAAETVDHCVHEIADLALRKGYTILLTADHGNSDYLINEDGSPNTAHTKNPVPLFMLNNELANKYTLKNGKLADVAPTILTLMGLPIPPQMTGEVLTMPV
jgi:2,3-bisphosphoglycerate-independent phosphoglycerate mutase